MFQRAFSYSLTVSLPILTSGCITTQATTDYGVDSVPTFPACNDWAWRNQEGLDVFPVWIGRYRDPRIQALPLESELERMHTRTFTFHPWASFPSINEAYEFATARQEVIVAAFTNRTTITTDAVLQSGAQCGNFVYVSLVAFWKCPEVILGHEIGHVLGWTHTVTGLMQPRPSCIDQEVGY